MKRSITCLALIVGCYVALASDTPPREVVDVAALVRQLGSEDFQEREAATEKLSGLVVEEPPKALLEALRSPDPEVRNRAAQAVKAIRDRAALRRLPRDERFLSRGQVDLYVAATATLRWKADDNRLWVPAFALEAKAIAKAEMWGPRKPHSLTRFPDFPAYRKQRNPRFIRQDGVYSREANDFYYSEVIQAACVANPRTISSSLFVSRGDVSAKIGISQSLILANGNVTTEDSVNSVVNNSVIICEGDVLLPR